MEEKSRDVFKGNHLAESMRHSGYRNTAMALAEIIDNSVEANSKHIEVLCAENQKYDVESPTKSIDKVAVFDDGDGMNKNTLWNSLIMAEGTRYERKGIGRFGMGLPNSSMSQCKKVTVYSWQTPDKIMSVYLDIDEELSIKPPKKTKIPDIWKNKSRYIKKAKSGTLVVWETIDKFQWKRSSTLQKNAEKIIGRVYRKFLHNNKLEISFVKFNSETGETSKPHNILPNDPLYQMTPSSTPKPWNKKPMFKTDGDNLEEIFRIGHHDVIIRCTLGTKDARKSQNGRRAGSLPHGKHANSNLGVSIIRANRELSMDTNLCQTYDPLERWWGLEIEFPSELDEIFGVSHTKQDAANFTAMMHEIGAITRDEEGELTSDISEYSGDMKDLWLLVERIDARIKSMRRTIKAERPRDESPHTVKPKPNPWPDPDPGPTVTGKQIVTMTDEERKKAILEAFSQMQDLESASEEARNIIENKINTKFIEASLNFPYFFDVSLKGGVTIITLNTDHPAYKHIVEIIENIPEGLDSETKTRFQNLRAAINLIFVSWAFYENHTLKDEDRYKLQMIRLDWGHRLRDLMKNLEV